MAITVLVVDDSAFTRQLIKKIIESDPEMKVVGVASDGEDALKKIEFYQPQVITLDLLMPQMDGHTFLSHLMATDPRPVVVISSWTTEEAEATYKALELGAVDFVTKPTLQPSEDLWELRETIIQKVKAAASVLPKKIEAIAIPKKEIVFKCPEGSPFEILGIGASTGGPRAIQFILTHLPPDFPLGILIAQHMPAEFLEIFSARLNSMGRFRVKLAEDREPVTPGKVLIAPYGLQTGVVRRGKEIRIKLYKDDSLYRPSVDYLFSSLAETFGRKAISILLTGMGADGAKGLKQLYDLGAKTIVEAEESCVIYGMPRAAVELGVAQFITPLLDIPNLICDLVTNQASR